MITARLEGGCHAGREGGELVAAVAPAAPAARLTEGVRARVTARAVKNGGEHERRRGRGLRTDHPPPTRSAVVCFGKGRAAPPRLGFPPGPPLPRRPPAALRAAARGAPGGMIARTTGPDASSRAMVGTTRARITPFALPAVAVAVAALAPLKGGSLNGQHVRPAMATSAPRRSSF